MAIDNKYRVVEEQAISVMKDVFGPVLNRDVNIEIIELEQAEVARLSEIFKEEAVLIEVPLESTTEGSLYYLFTQKLAAAITDLMVMGDGSAPFSDESLDGVAEAVNQIVGAQTTFWADELKVNLSFGNAQGGLVAVSDLNVPIADLIEVRYNMVISDWGDETFVKLVPNGVIDLLANASGGEISPEQEMAQSGFSSTLEPSGASQGTPAGKSAPSTARPAARAVQFGQFDTGGAYQPGPDDPRNLELLMDISLPVTIELGRTQMLIKDVLEIGPGSVIELQKLSGEPVDLYINDKRFALGEVVVIDENFGIRITELLSVEDRIKALK
ncbi:MAG: flagellar motor switch protein FliN [bacterium]